MKKILIILIVLLLLGGAGGGAYYWFVLKPQMDAAASAEPEPAPPPEPPEYMSMDNMTIPVIRNGRIHKYILVRVAVELSKELPLEIAEQFRPRLQDAYIQSLHGYFATQPLDAPINVISIQKRLIKASRPVVGKGRITDILIQGVFERKTG